MAPPSQLESSGSPKTRTRTRDVDNPVVAQLPTPFGSALAPSSKHTNRLARHVGSASTVRPRASHAASTAPGGRTTRGPTPRPSVGVRECTCQFVSRLKWHPRMKVDLRWTSDVCVVARTSSASEKGTPLGLGKSLARPGLHRGPYSARKRQRSGLALAATQHPPHSSRITSARAALSDVPDPRVIG